MTPSDLKQFIAKYPDDEIIMVSAGTIRGVFREIDDLNKTIKHLHTEGDYNDNWQHDVCEALQIQEWDDAVKRIKGLHQYVADVNKAFGEQQSETSTLKQKCEELERDLAKWRLEWKTGFILEDGKYWRMWINPQSGKISDVRISEYKKGDHMVSENDYFAGPINLPHPEKEGEKG